jgi:DNA-3-methyladenine glycosylase I
MGSGGRSSPWPRNSHSTRSCLQGQEQSASADTARSLAIIRSTALTINQAGLSWLTILKKRDNFRAAFDGFDLERVATYRRRERARLLRDAGIIRNRLKIDAVIENARRIVEIREAHGSLAKWLDAHHPRGKAEWVKLFKKTFLFTGGEITGEFLLSTGYLPGAHVPACPVYLRVARLKPPWMRR